MRSRSVDVLRPVVELINFNLNVIKICGFPAFSVEKKKQPRRVLWKYFSRQLGTLWSVFVFYEVISGVFLPCWWCQWRWCVERDAVIIFDPKRFFLRCFHNSSSCDLQHGAHVIATAHPGGLV